MLKLALRNVFRQRLRTAMGLGAIATGVVALILTGGFVNDIFAQLGEAIIHSQTGHLQISNAGFHHAGARKPEQYRLRNPDELAARISTVRGVSGVTARTYFSGLLNNGRTDIAIVGEGVEPGPESRLGTSLMMESGRRLRPGDRESMMVGSGVAKALKLAPGATVTLMLNTDAGALDTLDFEVVGVFKTYSMDYDAHAIRIPLGAAREILGNRDANVLVVSLENTRDTELVGKALRAKLTGAGMEVLTWKELNDFYAKTVTLYDRQFGVLRLIVLLMVFLSVVNSINMGLFERIAEFGTMRALGDSARFVARLILTETSILGVAGAAIGVAVGTALAVLISLVGIPMPAPPNSDLGYTAHIRLVPDVVFGAFLVGLVASALAGIPSAVRLSRMPVVDALRHAI